jgi:hypothetical protein
MGAAVGAAVGVVGADMAEEETGSTETEMIRTEETGETVAAGTMTEDPRHGRRRRRILVLRRKAAVAVDTVVRADETGQRWYQFVS